jgi:uncharacterized membrane protein
VGPYFAVVDAARMFSLVVGSLVIFLGILRATREVRGAAGGRDRVAREITDHAGLGLEFFVAAAILNLVLDPTWPAVAITAVIIAVRQLIAFSLSLARSG